VKKDKRTRALNTLPGPFRDVSGYVIDRNTSDYPVVQRYVCEQLHDECLKTACRKVCSGIQVTSLMMTTTTPGQDLSAGFLLRQRKTPKSLQEGCLSRGKHGTPSLRGSTKESDESADDGGCITFQAPSEQNPGAARKIGSWRRKLTRLGLIRRG
jgi:hypothetical protein